MKAADGEMAVISDQSEAYARSGSFWILTTDLLITFPWHLRLVHP
jgi:hypothetical protein